jgi:SAM-dependent methyltransferase
MGLTPTPSETDTELRFAFGKNWRSFLKTSLNEERIQKALDHILGFVGRPDLRGLRVIDIGSGSGIHSLAMHRAGAEEILSFDYDPDSVAATEQLHRAAGSPASWRVKQGSVLDADLMGSLGTYDLVYSWGVLHHTGQVWQALSNALLAASPGGLVYIALYDSDWSKDAPEYWLDIKQRYVRASPVRKRLMELEYVWKHQLERSPARMPELLKYVKGYRASRGMDFYHDVKDWLGGWPMEYTRIHDVLPRVLDAGFSLLRTRLGEANTEYLFARAPADAAETTVTTVPLPTPLDWNVTTIRSTADMERLDRSAPLYIYGAGNGGVRLLSALTQAGFKSPVAFLTSGAPGEPPKNRDGSSTGVKVMSFADYLASPARSDRDELIIASTFYDQISFTLIQNGISRFHNAMPFLL